MELLWNLLTNTDQNLKIEDSQREYAKLLNQFTLVVFLVFLLHAIHNLYFIYDWFSGFIFLGISLFFPLTLFFPEQRKKRELILFVFLVLSLVIFYFDSYLGMDSGFYLYYFPTILATQFVFRPSRDSKYILGIIIFIICLMAINIATNYALFYNQNIPVDFKRNTLKISLFTSTLILFVNIIFIIRKNLIIDKLYEQPQKSDEKKNSAFIKELKRVGALAKENDPTFFSAFTELYPEFSTKLLSLNPRLSIQELEFCALIKLGFNTKDIAQNMKLSVRAIEGRKYRVRKKLGFSTEKNLIVFMHSLE